MITNNYSDDNCDLVEEIQQVKKQQQQEIPAPSETTSDRLMKPGSGEVED